MFECKGISMTTTKVRYYRGFYQHKMTDVFLDHSFSCTFSFQL